MRSPVVIVLLILLAFTTWFGLDRDHKLNRVCALVGPHDIMAGTTQAHRQAIDNICVNPLDEKETGEVPLVQP